MRASESCLSHWHTLTTLLQKIFMLNVDFGVVKNRSVQTRRPRESNAVRGLAAEAMFFSIIKSDPDSEI